MRPKFWNQQIINKDIRYEDEEYADTEPTQNGAYIMR